MKRVTRRGMVGAVVVAMLSVAAVAMGAAGDAGAGGTRRLWVVRHADATPMAEGLTDRTRGLTERGVKQAEWLGAEIGKRAGADAKGLVLTSGFERSKRTGEIIGGALKWERRDETSLEGRDKQAGLDVIERELARTDAAGETLVLVGHIPQLDQLMNHLTHPERALPMRWGEAALFEVKLGADGKVESKLIERIRLEDGKGD